MQSSLDTANWTSHLWIGYVVDIDWLKILCSDNIIIRSHQISKNHILFGVKVSWIVTRLSMKSMMSTQTPK